MPVILHVSQSSAVSDINGLASITTSSLGFSPPVEVDVAVSAGASALLDHPLFVLPEAASDAAPSAVALPHPIRKLGDER